MKKNETVITSSAPVFSGTFAKFAHDFAIQPLRAEKEKDNNILQISTAFGISVKSIQNFKFSKIQRNSSRKIPHVSEEWDIF